MSGVLEKTLARYDFEFPKELIAQEPARPRDAAKLLVAPRRRGESRFDAFRNLPQYLPPGAVLVLNDTKVVPARLAVRKPTGGVLKLLYIAREGNLLAFLSPQNLEPGTILAFGRFTLTVIRKRDSEYLMRPSFAPARILALLDRHGEVPLPPYIKGPNPKSARVKEDYQTVFAKRRGSVAAPTASLHFTKGLLARIRREGHEIVTVTLHVNLGTFAPLTAEQLRSKKLHEEEYSISPAAARVLEKAKREGRPIIAVGTTVVRTLESAADRNGKLTKLSGETDLFIGESYRLKFVDGLITNFHVPRSSLLMLVSAFVPRQKLLQLYRAAIERRFRLFSFGDGMLIY